MEKIDKLVEKLKEIKDSVTECQERVQGYVEEDKLNAAEKGHTYSQKEENQIEELEGVYSNLKELSEFINNDIEYLDGIFKYLNEDVEEILERILK